MLIHLVAHGEDFEGHLGDEDLSEVVVELVQQCLHFRLDSVVIERQCDRIEQDSESEEVVEEPGADDDAKD